MGFVPTEACMRAMAMGVVELPKGTIVDLEFSIDK